jgi:16S rRNA (uracil1498-N3)-methyltransferase
MQLFYDKHISTATSTHLMEPVESNHILRVLRKQIGEELHITNGSGFLFRTKIIEIQGKKCLVEVLEYQTEELPASQLHIAIAPTKSSDRFEFFLEKATEIGISEITPLITQNSERKKLNIKRCQKIIESAMKQSQRLFLPKLNELTRIDQFLENTDASYSHYIAHCEEDQKKEFNTVRLQHNVCVLIGPEGDFSPQEIESALEKKFLPISLGTKRLRTETAGIHVCSIFAIKDSLRFS